MYDNLAQSAPFHCGCTYSHWNFNAGGEITSKQYGCDYLHDGDEMYERFKIKDEAIQVFADGKELWNWLSN
jgi:hypothetical protein